jgi:hypothetical protein
MTIFIYTVTFEDDVCDNKITFNTYSTKEVADFINNRVEAWSETYLENLSDDLPVEPSHISSHFEEYTFDYLLHCGEIENGFSITVSQKN